MTGTPKQCRGFTLVEVLISSVILSALVLAAASISKTALFVTGSVVRMDAADGRVQHTLQTLRNRLLSASVATLQAVPAVSGGVPEPMQAAVDYDNIRFRLATGFVRGEVVLTPPDTEPPWRFFLSDGALWLDDGGTPVMLLDHVTSAAFRLSGKHLEVTLVTGRPDGLSDATVELAVILLVP